MSDSSVRSSREAEGRMTDERAPTVLVVDRVGRLASALAEAADGMAEVLRLRRPTHLVEVAGAQEPDVIVAGPGEVTHAGLRRLARVHRAHPKTVILLSPNGVSKVSLSETAASGVSDVIPYPATAGRMRVVLQRALDVASELRAEHIVVKEVPAPAQPISAATRTADVITVTSATGGCGKTFYATNIAAYLHAATGGKVLVCDLDLQFGEVAVSLRIRPVRTIAELIEEDDLVTALPNYVVSHESGFDVLCAPEDPIAAERIGPRETTAVLDAARQHYDYVVVDTPPSLNEVVLAAFDRSRALVVMATLDVPSLRNLRVFLRTLDRLQIEADDVSIVVNKAERSTGIDIGKVERVYPQGFASVLPYSSEVTRSINVGKPVITTSPGEDVSRKLVAGAKKLVPPADGVRLMWDNAKPATGSWWSKWFKKGA
jgi:pilus assembly protein CpaE